MLPRNPDRYRTGKRGQRGVVLLDIVAALAVVALVAFVLMPKPRSATGAAELTAEAVRISAEIRKGRAKAIGGGGTVDVLVDPDKRKVQVQGATAVTVRNGVDMRWVTSNQCPLRQGRRALRFLADGRSCGAVMTLSVTGRSIELRVDWLTGRVEMTST